jgi:hypothetical protein
MSSLPLKPSKPQLKNNSPNRLSFLELTVVVNTPPMNSMLFVLQMALLIIFHAFTPLNRMALLRGSIEI